MSLLSIKSIAPDAELSVAIALHFAKLSLPIWKESYPNDSRPEDTIKAVEHYVSTDAGAAARAALRVGNAAYAALAAARAAHADALAAFSYADASCAADAGAADADADALAAFSYADASCAANAASCAADAANAAAYAASAARAAANAAAYGDAAANAADHAAVAANAAAYAALAAARAADATCAKSFIRLELIKQLSDILSYKVKNGQSFGEPDAVFENLAESDAKLFLFNLDSLR